MPEPLESIEILQKIEPILHRALEAGRPPLTDNSRLWTPCRDLLDRGGKRWRPILLVHCTHLVTDDAEKFDAACHLTPLVEFAHTASLIHDDIEDASDMRRGGPAIHIIYGLDRALNAASWLYFQAQSCLDAPRISPETRLRLYSLYASEMRRLHRGQAMDIQWHNEDSFPTIDEYFTMVTLKTGTLASLAAQVGLIAGGADSGLVEEAGAVASHIGAAFQILDDITNLTRGNPGKKRGDDVVEGKKSYPVLLHLKARPDEAEKIAGHFALARVDGIDSPAVAACINMLEASGALEQAAQDARAMLKTNVASFAALFPHRPQETRRVTELFEGMS